jgi:hypothetical protein
MQLDVFAVASEAGQQRAHPAYNRGEQEQDGADAVITSCHLSRLPRGSAEVP